jgi:hypothetical protein
MVTAAHPDSVRKPSDSVTSALSDATAISLPEAGNHPHARTVGRTLWCDRWKPQKLIGGILGVIATGVTTAFRYATSFGSAPPVATTLLPVATGLSVQTAILSLLPSRISKVIVRLQLRNTWVAYFALIQGELNGATWLRPVTLGLVGAYTTAKVVVIAVPKISGMTMSGRQPLLPQSPGSPTRNRPQNSGPLRLFFNPSEFWQRKIPHLCRIVSGGTLIGLNYAIPAVSPHALSAGIGILGWETGSTAVTLARYCKTRVDAAHQEDIAAAQEPEDIPKSVVYTDRFFQISQVVGTQGVGIGMFFLPHPVACFAVGGLVGGLMKSAIREFEQGVHDDAYRCLVPAADKIQRYVNIVMPGLAAAWYIFGMVSISDDSTLSSNDKRAQYTALSLYVGGTGIGMGVTGFANARFRPGHNGALMNLTRFMTREGAVLLVLPGAYIQGIEKIGNIALSKLSDTGQLFAAIAWLFNGLAVGNAVMSPIATGSPAGDAQMIRDVVAGLAGKE